MPVLSMAFAVGFQISGLNVFLWGTADTDDVWCHNAVV